MTLLVVMGSGETTPTMVTTHQRVLAAVPADAPRLVLDTPYGFQENADELSARTVTYFARNVGEHVEVASLRSAEDLTPVVEETLVARLREAGWVFAGPGSPTYLARQWRPTALPETLRQRLQTGDGAVVFASAAAVTLGANIVPVYEIYKAGEPPRWEPGLDLLAGVGLDVAVVPHFDNREGGTHDTRYCYLGARRLAVMETLLPDDTWILGVDEHTAVTLDLAGGDVHVEGRGGVTVRAREGQVVFPAGTTTTVDALVAAATGTADVGPPPGGRVAATERTEAADGAPTPLLEEIATAAAGFDAALGEGDALAAAEVTVGLVATVRAWGSDSEESDEADRAYAEVRRQVVAIARIADAGWHEHRDLVEPLVERLLALRGSAREEGRYGDADAIRDTLAAAGVEVQDSPAGTDWHYDDPVAPHNRRMRRL